MFSIAKVFCSDGSLNNVIRRLPLPRAPLPSVLRARQFQRRHFAAALVYLAVAVALPAVVIKRVLALSDDSSQGPNKVSIGVAYRVAAWVACSF